MEEKEGEKEVDMRQIQQMHVLDCDDETGEA
jgi:hypothetical protein